MMIFLIDGEKKLGRDATPSENIVKQHACMEDCNFMIMLHGPILRPPLELFPSVMTPHPTHTHIRKANAIV